MHVELQPSPSTVPPSSHSWNPRSMPSPHVSVQSEGNGVTVAQVKPVGSSWHVWLQPSLGNGLPSSHSYEPRSVTSPQISTHGNPSKGHKYPASSSHAALHPSPSSSLKSSQRSVPSITPSPHARNLLSLLNSYSLAKYSFSPTVWLNRVLVGDSLSSI